MKSNPAYQHPAPGSHRLVSLPTGESGCPACPTTFKGVPKNRMLVGTLSEALKKTVDSRFSTAVGGRDL
jgi:hypothetical protein